MSYLGDNVGEQDMEGLGVRGSEAGVDLRDRLVRRNLSRLTTCNHKSETREDSFGSYWVCDKTDTECWIEGKCPSDCRG